MVAGAFWRSGVAGTIQAHPLIRAKAIRADEDVMARTIVGYLSSWAAVRRQNNPVGKDERVKRKQAKLMRQR